VRRFEANLQFGIRWPYQASFLNPTPLRQPPRMRAQRSATAGSYCSRKMGRLVQYDSQEERDFYRELEQLPDVIWYQEQPVALPYTNGAHQSKYFPDVLISFTDGRSVLAEIKQCHSPFRYDALVKARHLIEYCERAGMGFFIGDHRRSFHDLLSIAQDDELDRELAHLAMRATIPWIDLKSLRHRLGRKAVELAAAILRMGLVVEESPVRARNATPDETAVISEVTRWFVPPEVERRFYSSAEVQEPAGAPNAYRRWTKEEEDVLVAEFARTGDVRAVAEVLGRKPNGVRRRLERLGIGA
jgi:hypothetical protein